MKKNVVLILLVLIISLSIYAEEVSEYYFRFDHNENVDLNKITSIISIDNIIDGYVYAYATPPALQEFQQLGYNVEILQHPGKLYQPRMSNSLTEWQEWEAYPTYDAFIDIMNQFELDYPDLCSVTSLGNTINGREIMIAKISDNVNDEEAEPEYLYTSTMHGDELVGYILLLNLIDHLLSNYGSDPQATELVNGLEIWIAPLTNPDGTYQGGNNTVFGATRFNANGVDLNRNYPDPAYGPHPDGNDWQPETIIMMDFAEDNHITMGANLHSGAELINYPWDTWPELHPDDDWYYYTSVLYASTAQANSPAGYLTDENNGVTNGYAWYALHGGRQDYMNYFHHAREVTMELSHTKVLPENQLANYWNYNRDALLLYMQECLYGLHGIVSNDLGDPIDAKIFVVDHDDRNTEVYTDPLLGDYHRLLAPGTYDIEFSSYGYLDHIENDVVITEAVAANLNVSLQAAPQFNISGTVINGNTGDPLANVSIELMDTPLDPALTNDAGFYQIDGVYQGLYSVYLSADGYSAIMQEINVHAGNTEFDFVIYESEIESFESGNFESFPWSFDGDAIWVIDYETAFDGDNSARSGAITHNQETSLLITVNTTAFGTLSFYYKVSSEQNYDFLEFYIDGNQMNSWSGNIDWKMQDYLIEPGEHTFQWTYDKDGSVSGGNDCAWLDLISFPCTSGNNAYHELPQTNISLLGNHPNPFNPSTKISFVISSHEPLFTELKIYNLKGQMIKNLVSEPLSSGIHNYVWDGTTDSNKTAASGLYFYKLVSADQIHTGKMLMLK